MNLKRYIAVVSALIFLFSLLAAFAARVPGSTEDPVVSLSYIQEKFIPNILKKLEEKLSVFNSDNMTKADTRTGQMRKDAENNLSAETGKLREQVVYDTYMRLLDDGLYLDSGKTAILTLRAGERLVVTSNSSFTVLQGSAFIGGREQKKLVDVTAGAAVNTNSAASRNARYVAVDDGIVSIKAVSDTVKISVTGNYSIFPITCRSTPISHLLSRTSTCSEVQTWGSSWSASRRRLGRLSFSFALSERRGGA